MHRSSEFSPVPCAPPLQLILRTINAARSAYMSVTLDARFFDEYHVFDCTVVQAGILMKVGAGAVWAGAVRGAYWQARHSPLMRCDMHPPCCSTSFQPSALSA